jgi:hypothetical protein
MVETSRASNPICIINPEVCCSTCEAQSIAQIFAETCGATVC